MPLPYGGDARFTTLNNNLSHFLHPERDIHKMFTDFDIFLLQFPACWVIMY